MRPATVKDRRAYYLNEFRVGKVKRWFDHWSSPVVFPFVIGRQTRIFPKEHMMERHQGLSFCRLELQLARMQVLELYELLSRRFGDIQIVYSGRGFHLHVSDDKVLWWTRKKRLAYANSLIRKGFVMDEWVA